MSELPACLMSPRETERLVAEATNRLTLELGAWHGETTAQLAQVAAQVWTIDHHRGDRHTGPADTLADYFDTLERAGVRDQVVSVVGVFGDVLHMLRQGTFDMVIVDGEHDAASVGFQVAYARMLLAPGGTLALHDWGRWDVEPAARTTLPKPHAIVDSLALWDL